MLTLFNDNQFYPTPNDIISKMLDGIELREIRTILEPSAGSGNIVEFLIKKYNNYGYRYVEHFNIDTIEINEQLQGVLKTKKIRVIHDDFLTFNTYKNYDLIIANPPFIDGEKHILKMLEIQKQYGGQIVCLLNAETIKNPYSVYRKDLVRQLTEYNTTYEFIQNGFTDADRKTDVEVVIVKVNIPKIKYESTILNNLRKEPTLENTMKDANIEDTKDITHAEFFENIVEQYNFEIKLGITLIKEYQAMQPLIAHTFEKSDSKSPILKLEVDFRGNKDSSGNIINDYIKRVRYKYWETLFQSKKLGDMLTDDLRYEYMSKIDNMVEYDFTIYNILQIKIDINNSMTQSIEKTILKLFDDFSHKHHWNDETSKNVHYYNGWKSNSAHKISKRVILPNMQAFDSYNGRFNIDYRLRNRIADIEKTFDYLDGRKSDHQGLNDILQDAQKNEITSKVELRYFKISFKKKGTAHIEFANIDLLDKFNIFAGKFKMWLPPSYAKCKYEDMSKEEQIVVDEFQGKEEYAKIYARKDYFICDTSKLLMLA
jgi:hypothetical protein